MLSWRTSAAGPRLSAWQLMSRKDLGVFRVSILGLVVMVLGRYLIVGYLDP